MSVGGTTDQKQTNKLACIRNKLTESFGINCYLLEVKDSIDTVRFR